MRGEKKEGRRGGACGVDKAPLSLPPSPLEEVVPSPRGGRPPLPTPLGLQSHENIPRGDPGSGEPALNERISTRLASPRGLRKSGFVNFFTPSSGSSLLLPSPKRTSTSPIIRMPFACLRNLRMPMPRHLRRRSRPRALRALWCSASSDAGMRGKAGKTARRRRRRP